MSQESVTQAPNAIQQTAQTVEGMLRQLNEDVGQVMGMVGEINERLLRVAKFKEAPTSSPNQREIWNKGEITLKKPMELTKITKVETPIPMRPQDRPQQNLWPNPPPTQGSKYPPSNIPRAREVSCSKCQGKGHYARECPNKRMLLVDEFGEYYSASEDEGDAVEEPKQVLTMGDGHEENVVEIKEGVNEALVLKKVLNSHSEEKNEDEDASQRTNLFRAICYVEGMACTMVIDGGSSVNIASTCLVDNFGLPTFERPQPYYLQWLNEKGELPVTKQVLISLSIGGYKDEVLCDVVPMNISHLLLGRPWQYDRKTKHDGVTNEYLISHKGKEYLLKPLTPSQAARNREGVQRDMEAYERRKLMEKEGPLTLWKLMGESFPSNEDGNDEMVLHIHQKFQEKKPDDDCVGSMPMEHIDFVFGEREWVTPTLIVPSSLKHQLACHMEMTSLLQIRGGWIEKYLMVRLELPRQYQSPPRLRAPKEVTSIHNLHFNSNACIVICFILQSLEIKFHSFQKEDEDEEASNYTCIYWILGFMLTKKMFDAHVHETCLIVTFLLSHFVVCCFDVLLCFDVGVASWDLRSNPCEEGGNDEDITSKPQETQANEALRLKSKYKLAHFRVVKPLVKDLSFEDPPGVRIVQIIYRWKAKT